MGFALSGSGLREVKVDLLALTRGSTAAAAAAAAATGEVLVHITMNSNVGQLHLDTVSV
jgi:hypothetical protein